MATVDVAAQVVYADLEEIDVFTKDLENKDSFMVGLFCGDSFKGDIRTIQLYQRWEVRTIDDLLAFRCQVQNIDDYGNFWFQEMPDA